MSDFYHNVNTLANTNDIPKVYLYYLVSALTNINNILKVYSCYLANTLTNTKYKADNSIKKRFI